MTTQRSLSTAIPAQRERSTPNCSVQSQASGLIANPRLEFDVSHRKNTPVKISNRKKIAISHFTKRHKHSRLRRATKGLCAFAKPRIRHIEAIASQAPEFPQSPRQKFLVANGSRFCISFFRASAGSPHSPPQSRSCLPDKLPSLSGSMLESKTTWTHLRLPRKA
jgi:hypothetical protein